MDITEQLTHESRIALAAVAEITRLRAEVEALKLQRTAAELVHRETATTVLMQMAEVESLKAKAAAFHEWHAKTEWVQETAEARELGMHRADVMRKRIEALRADAERLTGERDVAIGMLAYWCVAVDQNGTGWDDWDEHYKDAMYRPCPIRELLDKEINAVRAAQGGA